MLLFRFVAPCLSLSVSTIRRKRISTLTSHFLQRRKRKKKKSVWKYPIGIEELEVKKWLREEIESFSVQLIVEHWWISVRPSNFSTREEKQMIIDYPWKISLTLSCNSTREVSGGMIGRERRGRDGGIDSNCCTTVVDLLPKVHFNLNNHR